MKERELRERADCALCGRKIGQASFPTFYVFKVSRFMLDFGAMKRQAGLEQFFDGHVALAQAMGPNEDLATEIMSEQTLTVCEDCSTDTETMVAQVIQASFDAANSQDDGDEGSDG